MKSFKNNHIENNNNQLEIPFDFGYSKQINLNSQIPYFLLNIELAKFPFFFLKRSEIVSKSRVGLAKYKVMKKLESEGMDRKTIEKATEINTSLYSLIHSTEFISSNKEKETWTINAHPFFGFPDEFDSFVWDYILFLISSIYYETHNINPYICFNRTDICNFFIHKNYFKTITGAIYEKIDTSIQRMLFTKYNYSKGFWVSRSKNFTGSDYQFSLIKNIYRKNTILKDTDNNNEIVSSDYCIQIEPIIYFNFINNYFLLSPRSVRLQLTNLTSKTLYDKLNYMLYHSLTNSPGDYCTAMKYNGKLFRIISSDFFFDSVGRKNILTYHNSKVKNYKSVLFQKIKPFFEELISINFLSDYFIDKSLNNKLNIVFIYNNNYIDDFINILGNKQKQKLDQIKRELTPEMISSYYKKINTFICESENISRISNL